MTLPGLHELRLFPLRDQIYRPRGAPAPSGEAPFQTVEGLSIGVDVAVRYALDPARVVTRGRGAARPTSGASWSSRRSTACFIARSRRTPCARFFSTKRAEIQKQIEDELRPELLPDGIVLRSVFLGNVDLPPEYRAGLESLLVRGAVVGEDALHARAQGQGGQAGRRSRRRPTR